MSIAAADVVRHGTDPALSKAPLQRTQPMRCWSLSVSSITKLPTLPGHPACRSRSQCPGARAGDRRSRRQPA